ncbi:hypothetical protein [Cobetia marina]
MSKQVEIQMGALAPSITQQLADQGVDIAPADQKRGTTRPTPLRD